MQRWKSISTSESITIQDELQWNAYDKNAKLVVGTSAGIGSSFSQLAANKGAASRVRSQASSLGQLATSAFNGNPSATLSEVGPASGHQ